MSYPLDEVFEEVAFLAYHFHWPLEDILALEHADRARFIGRDRDPRQAGHIDLRPGLSRSLLKVRKEAAASNHDHRPPC